MISTTDKAIIWPAITKSKVCEVNWTTVDLAPLLVSVTNRNNENYQCCTGSGDVQAAADQEGGQGDGHPHFSWRRRQAGIQFNR